MHHSFNSIAIMHHEFMEYFILPPMPMQRYFSQSSRSQHGNLCILDSMKRINIRHEWDDTRVEGNERVTGEKEDSFNAIIANKRCGGWIKFSLRIFHNKTTIDGNGKKSNGHTINLDGCSMVFSLSHSLIHSLTQFSIWFLCWNALLHDHHFTRFD